MSGRTPSSILADNLYGFQMLGRLSQREVAERMRALDHKWHQQTVSSVEDSSRPVTTDELVGLALVLWRPIVDLLNPAGPDGAGAEGLTVGGDVAYPDDAAGLDPGLVATLLTGQPSRVVLNGSKIELRTAPR